MLSSKTKWRGSVCSNDLYTKCKSLVFSCKSTLENRCSLTVRIWGLQNKKECFRRHRGTPEIRVRFPSSVKKDFLFFSGVRFPSSVKRTFLFFSSHLAALHAKNPPITKQTAATMTNTTVRLCAFFAFVEFLSVCL